MKTAIDLVREKFERLSWVMDERLTRLWAATEARGLGRGGAAIVTAATGIREKRLLSGMRELDEIGAAPPTEKPQDQRIRREGGGRKRLTDKDPTLKPDLESLVDPVTRGDPESLLRWTSKSKAKLAEELQAMGHKISPTMVGRLLHEMGYSLQAPSKTTEGAQSPDRNAQFEHINAEATNFMARGQPVVSVDAKKKELVGDFKNGGREWHPEGEPARVRVHDFVDKKLGKAIPYGIYDTARNEAWVSVGVDHDTAEFAVATLLRWWRSMGKKVYSNATELLITADAGGSNSSRSRLWKSELQKFANETGLRVNVSHFPPGTSKWNKIEHRLFSQITHNWRGRPLVSHEAIVNLIGNTTTSTGLRVRARLDKRPYPTGIKVPNATMKSLAIDPHDVFGNWNYALNPMSADV